MDTASPRDGSLRAGTWWVGLSRWGPWIWSQEDDSVSTELCWDTSGSASPFELSHQCQDPQALAVGQRGPPSLTRLGKPQKFDIFRHHFQELHHLPQEKYPPYTYPHQQANAEIATEGSTSGWL